MGTKRPLLEMDPASLPPGTRVGPWRVKGWCGRGTYGTVYQVEREGHAEEGPYALKLALYAEDERFKREAALLSRIRHPNVPRLEGQGVWEHRAGAFPYLVMQWVEGESLYAWSSQRNPTSRQVLRRLAQVARALEVTHAAGGVHRDVKGDNVLVWQAEERAVLTDFGAGTYRGAGTITSQPLPPGTPRYRSPEAWAFQRLFCFHPSEHYRGSACDDLFALGVMAYRLVTDEYPPPTEPSEEGAEVWRRGGLGPRPPRALNARVSPKLDAIILRLLSQPEERFKGNARRTAEALEHAALSAGAEADIPLFEWEELERAAWPREDLFLAELLGHRPRRRDLTIVSQAEQADASAKVEAERVKAKQRIRVSAHGEREHLREQTLRWLSLGGAVATGLLFTLKTDWAEHAQGSGASASARDVSRDGGAEDGGTSGLGQEVLTAPMAIAAPVDRRGFELDMPGKLFKGQRRAPCQVRYEVEIRGGCWIPIRDIEPPCGDDSYEWKSVCYAPSFSAPRPATSEQP
ncbi:serine/threonine protein kinase [Hyalangium rubrum]|uniref:Serine/threonine-protein kinase n=1 Tax=Hyalangium rubrum TaxID=3103134 RepID=A0ABU5H4G3_9BACT|nr:serine/threonine-protein kinase [Hyalangium sp. s54d21]MDY7227992.1 serine/threonine-protein kinase [Hyalangium sp. s54d21]